MDSLQSTGILTMSLLAACVAIVVVLIVFKPASKTSMFLAGLTLALMIVITIFAVIMDLQMASSVVALASTTMTMAL